VNRHHATDDATDDATDHATDHATRDTLATQRSGGNR